MNNWDTGDKCVMAEDCSWAEQYSGATIWLTPEVNAVIRKLCEDVKTEWQMMLTGTEDKMGVWVTGYWIPKQEVTGASVTNLDCVDADVIRDKHIVCTIHSHSDMGVFFSGTDEKFTNNSLIKNHIVVNNKGQTKACMRYELPCKMTRFFDAMVKPIIPTVERVEGFENITHKTYQKYEYAHGYSGFMGNGLHEGKWGGHTTQDNWDTDGRKMKRKRKFHAITHGGAE